MLLANSLTTLPFNPVQLKTTMQKSSLNMNWNNSTITTTSALRRTGGIDSFQKAKNRTLKMVYKTILKKMLKLLQELNLFCLDCSNSFLLFFL